MAFGVVSVPHDLRARPQPDPFPRAVAQPQFLVDAQIVGRLQVFRQPQVIVWMDDGAQFVDGQKCGYGLHAQNLVHRVGPVDPAAADVPVPQTAAAPAERNINARAQGFGHPVKLVRAPRLPQVGPADHGKHGAGRCQQQAGTQRIHPPFAQQDIQRLNQRKLAMRHPEAADADEACHAARAFNAKRLRGANRRRSVGLPLKHGGKTGSFQLRRWHSGGDIAQPVCQQQLAAKPEAVPGADAFKQHARMLIRECRRLRLNFRGKQAREQICLSGGRSQRFVVCVLRLKNGARQQNYKKYQDEQGHAAPQSRFGSLILAGSGRCDNVA